MQNTNLKSLNLAKNRDLVLPEVGSLVNSKTIEHLSLAESDIDALPLNIFEGLPNLKTLDLRSNKVNVSQNEYLFTKYNINVRSRNRDLLIPGL